MLRSAGLGGVAQITDCLFISSGRTARDSSLIASLNITCVINATQDEDSTHLSGVEYVRVPISDDPKSRLLELLDGVCDRIQQESEARGRVLLHCRAGVSRSAAICLAYLMKHGRLTLADAHTLLKTHRPIIRPNPGFWSQLIEYERTIYGENTVRMIDSPIGQIPDLYEPETRGLIPL